MPDVWDYRSYSVDTKYGPVKITILPNDIQVQDERRRFIVNRVEVDLSMSLKFVHGRWEVANYRADRVWLPGDWNRRRSAGDHISRSAADKIVAEVPAAAGKWLAERGAWLDDEIKTAEEIRDHNRCIVIADELMRKESDRDRLNDEIRTLRMEYMQRMGKRDGAEPVYAE